VDNTFVYGIVAGIVAYVLGRSRRNAFVCAVLGISLSQIIQWIINWKLGAPTVLGLGVGGAFGTYVIAILISVGLCEFFGRAFTEAKPDNQEKRFNFKTHTYDSEKNGKLVKDQKQELEPTNKAVKNEVSKQKQSVGIKNNTKTALKCILMVFMVARLFIGATNPTSLAFAANTETKTYYTVYDYSN
jgi:hypothetical protein